MPHITRFSVNHFRNIESVNIEPTPSLNLVYGENGAGKTSLLEAIAYVSRGKSFRSNVNRRVIKHEKDGLVVFAQVVSGERDDSSPSKIGVQKLRSGKSSIKVNDEKVERSSDLAKNLPVLVLDNVAFDLLGAGAKERRQFFDWLVFHVEHDFVQAWKSYSRLIKHRNSLLRHDRISYSEFESWDKQIAEAAATIQRCRSQCLSEFIPIFVDYLTQCNLDIEGKLVEIEYAKGWKHSTPHDNAVESSCNNSEVDSYIKDLKGHFDKDRNLGYTSIGSHRSELKVLIGRVNAGELLSRGQQKIVVVALFFAAAAVFRKKTGSTPVVLIDDLPSELDTTRQMQVAQWLKDLDCQSFLTGIHLKDLERMAEGREFTKVFHVEHGEIVQASLN